MKYHIMYIIMLYYYRYYLYRNFFALIRANMYRRYIEHQHLLFYNNFSAARTNIVFVEISYTTLHQIQHKILFVSNECHNDCL